MQSLTTITHTTKSTITTIPSNNSHKNISRRASTAAPQPRSHNGSTTQACAACKYQRRKCASDCILAPYFPHDRQLQFLNAHRLFGVSNIIKIVGKLKQPEKDHAMRTIIFQSDLRAADPVGGCYRVIRDLEQRISLANAELDIVLHHLALCRAAAQQQAVVPPPGGGDSYDEEKWRGQYVGEEEAAVEDLNSWGCMAAGDVHAHAESTSSSFPQHVRKVSTEECNNDMIRPILDHLVCDDGGEEEFEFDANGNIIPRNSSISTEEKVRIKEDNDCFSYVEDQHDINLKAAANFFSLTNCDI